MSARIRAWWPALMLAVWVVFSGCGNLPQTPTIDQIRAIPSGSQSVLLAPEQFSPKEGPIGTLLTVNGRGTLFPAGICRFTFSGTGAVEFDVPDATEVITVPVPINSRSGPFGFTIAGRRSNLLENSLPTSNVFQAWRFDAPGFRVVDPTGIPGTLISPPPKVSDGANG